LQRIGLSATCAPVATAARFLVGGGRACAVAEVNELAPLHLRIEPLPETEERNGFMARLLDRLDAELVENRTTLVFTNTRSLAERMTWALRRRYPGWAEQIGVHHSALSAVRRRLVERGLKHGKLRVAVSSTSLELGVDIGSVDQVVLVHPPGGVVRLLQRVGRSGHQPRQPRHGLVLTETPAALLEAAVTAASGRLVQLEPLTIPQHPLDVLCQHLLGMAVQSCWSPEDAFTLVRQAYPYRDLTRSDFDACLDYLSGRHSDGRTWLPARLRWENGEFTVADQRTIRLLRRNSGTIVADENRSVRLQDEERDPFAPLAPRFSPLIGEVDELFADRLQPGDRFVLDGRCLEYQRKDGSALLVSEVAGRPQAPRWPGSGWPLSAELARRLYLFRVQAAEALRDGPECLANLLQAEYALNGHAVQVLVELFTLQDTISEIPDHDACLIECVRTEIGAEYYVHTPLNRAGNDALARVLCLRLTRDRGLKVTVLAADLGFLLSVHARRDIAAGQWYELLSATNFDADLDAALRESNLLRECFRRNALIGLMLLRNPLGRRRRVGGRDWAERCLFDQVAAADADFVLLRQARREVCESCAAEAARDFLAAMPKLSLRCRWLARPSPLVENWTHTGVTATDAPALPAEALQALREMLTTVPG